MSVVIETTLGDITVDLYMKKRPRACLNFLKLCKIKYYNYNLFHTVSRGFMAQTGDPTGSRTGGESIWGVLEGSLKRYFEPEINPRIKHTIMGLISFVGNEDCMIGSQFFLTLGTDLSYLDEKHCVFGEVVEGQDVLEIINEAICDNDDRPYQDIRITHTVVLDDPFPDPDRLRIPPRSPSPSAERLQGGRIAPDEEIDELAGKTAKEIHELIAEREAKARATILEMIGDIPDAEIAPPENVLFVCKLNPVTSDDDLEIIFSRFGKIKSCEVIRDKKTGDSLQYAFVEFEERKSCEDAYFKMDNVLIDDRRIHVDFSQSVSKIKWYGKGRYKNFGAKDQDLGKGSYQRNEEKRDSKDMSHRRNDRHRREKPRSRERYQEEKPRSGERYQEEKPRSRERYQEEKPRSRERYQEEKPRSRERYQEKSKDRRPKTPENSRDRRERSRSPRRRDRYRDDEKRIDSNKRKDASNSEREKNKRIPNHKEKKSRKKKERRSSTSESEDEKRKKKKSKKKKKQSHKSDDSS